MNYRDKIRKAIECPQFGNDHYGEWGALRLDQRKYIKRLLDELDSADAYILKLYEEAQKQKEVIDKAVELLGNYKHYSTPDEKQNSDNEDLVNKAFDILNEVE